MEEEDLATKKAPKPGSANKTGFKLGKHKPSVAPEPAQVNLEEKFRQLELACAEGDEAQADELAGELVRASNCTVEHLARFVISQPNGPGYNKAKAVFGGEIRECAKNCHAPSVETALGLAVASAQVPALEKGPDWWWENCLKPRLEGLTAEFRQEFCRICAEKLAELRTVSPAFAASGQN